MLAQNCRPAVALAPLAGNVVRDTAIPAPLARYDGVTPPTDVMVAPSWLLPLVTARELPSKFQPATSTAAEPVGEGVVVDVRVALAVSETLAVPLDVTLAAALLEGVPVLGGVPLMLADGWAPALEEADTDDVMLGVTATALAVALALPVTDGVLPPPDEAGMPRMFRLSTRKPLEVVMVVHAVPIDAAHS